MSESPRKEKSQNDSDDWTKYCSELTQSNQALKSKDGCEWPAWSSLSGNPIGKKDTRSSKDCRIPDTTRAQVGDNNHGTNRTSGSDVWKQQNCSGFPESLWVQSCRGSALSLGQDWSGSRSRSRDMSGSRRKGRSRSPLHKFTQESCVQIRQSRSRLELCRDFVAGRCRRGSSCRFIHQEIVNDKNRRHPTRNCGSKLEGRGNARHLSAEEPMDFASGFRNFSDREKDEFPRMHRQNTSCNDFRKGKCHRGSSCRQVHDNPSGESDNKSYENAFSDHDYRYEQKNRHSSPCSYLERGLKGDAWGCNVKEEKKSWNKWGDMIADSAGFTGSVVADKSTNDRSIQGSVNENNPSEALACKERTGERVTDGFWSPRRQTDNNFENIGFSDKFGCSVKEGKKTWNKWGDMIASPEIADSAGWDNSNGGNTSFMGSIVGTKSTNDRLIHGLVNVNNPWEGQACKKMTAEAKTGECWSSKHRRDNNAADIVFSDKFGCSLKEEKKPWNKWSDTIASPEIAGSVGWDQGLVKENRPWEGLVCKTNVFETKQEGCTHVHFPESTSSARPSDKEPPDTCQDSGSRTLNTIPITLEEPNPNQDKQDFITESIESCKPDGSKHSHGILLMPGKQKSITPPECLPLLSATVGSNHGETRENGGTEEVNSSTNLRIKESHMGENGHLENLDAAVRANEGSKGKEEKETWIFRVALVEFVKEILKPSWKNGMISKEVHKIIVKKAVNRVIETIQGDHIQIPKTKEHVRRYLTYAKPKLTQLVQAYVDRFTKS